MKKLSQTGFTLIELMIVVAIIGILAFIAMSNYGESVLSSKRTDAKDALLNTAASLEKCKTTYGSYNNGNCSIQSGDAIQSSGGLYTIKVQVTDATNFSLEATPVAGKSQASDTDCKSITINNLGVQGGTTADCW